MRPILTPGSHVLRRNGHELQIGLEPRRAVVLPDDPAVRRCLDRLRSGAPVEEYDDRTLLDLLIQSGHVMDGSTLLPMIPTGSTSSGTTDSGTTAAGTTSSGSRSSTRRSGPVARATVAAVAHAVGDEAASVLARRRRTRVTVTRFDPARATPGADSTRPEGDLAGELAALLTAAGLTVSTGAHDIAVLLGVGEPPREALDQHMRDARPHLLLRVAEGAVTVGPFVVPGKTACLRCVDAHHTDADPSWPLLVTQFASATGRPRDDTVPEPVDPMLARVALGWAARDVATYAEGGRPSTWSTTLRLEPQLAAVETRSWLRHPECGCAWG